MCVPHQDPTVPIGFLNNMGYTKPQKIIFQIKRRQNVIDRRARSRPRGINPATRTPSTMNEDGLVPAGLTDAHASSNPGELGRREIFSLIGTRLAINYRRIGHILRV